MILIYENIVKGIFVSRPNRFIANVMIEGAEEQVHVKNTGRCRELLIEGTEVYLEKSNNPQRKTAYSLIAVNKEGILINMDSQVPNKVVFDALSQNRIKGISPEFVKREVTYKSSRFDIYFEEKGKKSFMEVKGVTLEENGYCRFPDAPTQRGVKHINELAESLKDGYEAYILFLIQFKGAVSFSPNIETDPEFASALKKASDTGVKIMAYDCVVAPDKIEINREIKIELL